MTLSSAACTSDDVSLGGAGASERGRGACVRGVDGAVVGDVLATSQAELDELAGCEEIRGSLEIRIAGPTSLLPLASLRLVRGMLLINGLAPASSLQSLEGLEALERVGELYLVALEIADLAPLRNLGQVRPEPLVETSRFIATSTVTIDQCEQLVDLNGLESLTDWDDFRLMRVASLESLRGLKTGRNGQRLIVQEAPHLRELASSEELGRMELVSMINTGLERFQPEDVMSVRRVELADNQAFVDALGLRALSGLEELILRNNDRLERLPEFPHLRVGLSRLIITDNDALRSIPAWSTPDDGDFLPSEYSDPADAPDYFFPPEFAMAEVANNSQLEALALPTIFRFGGRVRIHDNPRLTAIDLSFLDSADTLSIANNALLTRVDIPVLQSVHELHVVNNPSFASAVFDNVRSLSTEMRDNLGPSAP